jgi:hypothetical protein
MKTFRNTIAPLLMGRLTVGMIIFDIPAIAFEYRTSLRSVGEADRDTGQYLVVADSEEKCE